MTQTEYENNQRKDQYHNQCIRVTYLKLQFQKHETENAVLFSKYLMVASFQTLLHEMIHALLFVTHNYKDRESHGPEFCKHMRRINLLTGANVTVRMILSS